MSTTEIQVGVTESFDCSYLPSQQERLLVVTEGSVHNPHAYHQLLAQGFRRSSNQIYRPHCDKCNACIPVRISVKQFKKSRSQKRLINKCAQFEVRINHSNDQIRYPLFERYINERHADGAMYPATYEQYTSFAHCYWLTQWFIELYDGDRLIAVAVTDVTHGALSAIYTFFDPSYGTLSLGTYMVLEQIKLAEQLNMPYVYLGYDIQACQKMNYKRRFIGHECLIDGIWQAS